MHTSAYSPLTLYPTHSMVFDFWRYYNMVTVRLMNFSVCERVRVYKIDGRSSTNTYTQTYILYTHTVRAVFLSVRNLLCILSVSFSVFLFFCFFFFILYLFFAPPADDLMTWLTRSVSRSHHKHTHAHSHALVLPIYKCIHTYYIQLWPRTYYSIVTLHVRACNIRVHHR